MGIESLQIRRIDWLFRTKFGKNLKDDKCSTN